MYDRTYLDILVESPDRLGLGLDTLQTLALHLRDSLNSVQHRTLDDRKQRAGADERVRAQDSEHIREAIGAHPDVRLGVRLPLLVDVDALPSDDAERKLPGHVEA